MSHTNSTPNYGLPQYIGTDKPTYLGDMNSAYSTIDTQLKANADASTAATATANTAAATATVASTNATTALNTANSAASEAASATSAAASATATANTANTNANTALRASAANTIENLAPAYDPTLTYAVGDLVTFIDMQGSGKLYKCIIAVETPEAFNINKWDDVTTSEVYARPRVVLATVTSDGVKTRAELMSDLFANFVPNGSMSYRVRQIEPSANNLISDYHFTQYSNSVTEFCSVGGGISGSGGAILTQDITLSNDTWSFTINVLRDTTWNVTDLSSNIPTANQITWTLYAE